MRKICKDIDRDMLADQIARYSSWCEDNKYRNTTYQSKVLYGGTQSNIAVWWYLLKCIKSDNSYFTTNELPLPVDRNAYKDTLWVRINPALAFAVDKSGTAVHVICGDAFSFCKDYGVVLYQDAMKYACRRLGIKEPKVNEVLLLLIACVLFCDVLRAVFHWDNVSIERSNFKETTLDKFVEHYKDCSRYLEESTMLVYGIGMTNTYFECSKFDRVNLKTDVLRIRFAGESKASRFEDEVSAYMYSLGITRTAACICELERLLHLSDCADCMNKILETIKDLGKEGNYA